MFQKPLINFLKEWGISKTFIKRNKDLIDELTNVGVSIVLLDNNKYVWLVDNKFVLCSLRDVHPKLNELINILLLEYQNKRTIYNKLSLLLVSVSTPVIEHVLELVECDLKSLTDITLKIPAYIENLHVFVTRMDNYTTGIKLMEFPLVVRTLKFIFFREEGNISNHRPLISTLQVGNMTTDVLLYEGPIIITLIQDLYRLLGESQFNIFKELIIKPIKFVESKKKQRTTLKRARMSTYVRTWRDKRPSRIKTDLYVPPTQRDNKKKIF
jgi:hypothetical protein